MPWSVSQLSREIPMNSNEDWSYPLNLINKVVAKGAKRNASTDESCEFSRISKRETELEAQRKETKEKKKK